MSRTSKRASFYRGDALKPEQSVAYLMKRVLQSMMQRMDARLEQHDLTHAQWLPLFKLFRGHCATMAELSRDLDTDAGAMTRALDRLEAKGLIQRVRSVEDRRVVNLELTEGGKRVAQLVPPVLAEVLNGHLAGFTEAEWHTLLDLLQRMVGNGEALRDAEREAV